VGCGFSGRFEYEYEYRCTEYEYDRGPAFLKIPGLKLVAMVVLVLSIAVLVLVLDSIPRSFGGSLDQSSQHRYDPLQIAFAASIGFIVNRIEYP
jgi:hypothetical protein